MTSDSVFIIFGVMFGVIVLVTMIGVIFAKRAGPPTWERTEDQPVIPDTPFFDGGNHH